MNGEGLKFIAFMEKNQCMVTVKQFPGTYKTSSQTLKFKNL